MKDKILSIIKDRSIKAKLLLLLIVVAFFPMLVMSIISILSAGTIVENKTSSLSKEILKQIGKRLDKELKSIDDLTFKIVISDQVKEFLLLDRNDGLSKLSSVKRETVNFIQKSLSTTNHIESGIQIYSLNAVNPINIGYAMKIDHDYTKSSWFQVSQKHNGKVVFGSIRDDGNAKYIPIMRLIKDHNNKAIGVMRMALKPSFIAGIIGDTSLGENSTLMVINQKGTFIAHQNESQYGLQIDSNVIRELDEINSKKNHSVYKKINGSNQMLTIIPISQKGMNVFENPWYVAALIPRETINEGAIRIATIVISILAFCILLAFGLGYLFSNGILEPIHKLMKAVNNVSQGVLDVELEVSSKDEIGELSAAFMLMVKNLRELIFESKQAVNLVLQASNEIVSTTEVSRNNFVAISMAIDDIGKGAHQSSTKAEQGMNMMFKLSEEISGLLEMIREMNVKNQESLEYGQKSQTTIQSVLESSAEVEAINETIKQNVFNLASNTEEIRKMIDIIMGFAEQTNLLALNAAIEAAHNNHMGRGFEIVASEIKKLSKRSQDAARSINRVINNILENINTTVENFIKAQNIMSQEKMAVNENVEMLKSITDVTFQISKQMEVINSSITSLYKLGDLTKDRIEEIAAVVEETEAAIISVNEAAEEDRRCIDTLMQHTHGFRLVADNMQRTTSKFVIEEKIDQSI